jgi:hypothetical protein
VLRCRRSLIGLPAISPSGEQSLRFRCDEPGMDACR